MTFGSGIEMTGKERLRLPAEYAVAEWCVDLARGGLRAQSR
jgi:hypothetical protein